MMKRSSLDDEINTQRLNESKNTNVAINIQTVMKGMCNIATVQVKERFSFFGHLTA